jgi:hypothetical protein
VEKETIRRRLCIEQKKFSRAADNEIKHLQG